MNYYRPIITDDGLTLSLDGLIIDYYLSNPADREELSKILSTLDLKYAINVRHWSSLRIGTFRENFTFSFRDGSSFWLGFGLNEAKPNFGKIRLDANPNHCANHFVYQYLLGWLNQTCKSFQKSVKRFDLAIDFNADRADVELLKDHRAYTEIRKSREDRTQYLGARSTGNRVKLYNKSIESGQTGSKITRLELTIDPATPYQSIRWPRAYAIKTQQTQIDELHLTDTERVLLDGILAGAIDLTRLGRKTRLKLERYMGHYVQWLTVPAADYKQILNRANGFLAFPRVDLQAGPIDLDELPRSLPAWVRDTEKGSEEMRVVEEARGSKFAEAGD